MSNDGPGAALGGLRFLEDGDHPCGDGVQLFLTSKRVVYGWFALR
jgi:hypothetical protein